MQLDQTLVDAALRLLDERYPASSGVAAAVKLENGDILTGVGFSPEWGGGGLCAETGPICEAFKRDAKIVASVCVSRPSLNERPIVLTPCGICQERLIYWGGAVEVAVPHEEDPHLWQSKRLDEVQPYYWVKAYRNTSRSG